MTEECQHTTKDKEWELEYNKRIEGLSEEYNLQYELLKGNKIGVIGKYNFTYNEDTYLEIEELAIGMCEFLRNNGDEADYSILDEGFDIILHIF